MRLRHRFSTDFSLGRRLFCDCSISTVTTIVPTPKKVDSLHLLTAKSGTLQPYSIFYPQVRFHLKRCLIRPNKGWNFYRIKRFFGQGVPLQFDFVSVLSSNAGDKMGGTAARGRRVSRQRLSTQVRDKSLGETRCCRNPALAIVFCYLVILATEFLGCQPTYAIGSQVGLEFAIDAPWRIEPYPNKRGGLRYGPIPIVITFHDAVFDSKRNKKDFLTKELLNLIGWKTVNVGALHDIQVEERTKSGRKKKTFSPSQLTEIERKSDISKRNLEPPHEVCWPTSGMDCRKLLDITKTHEWHAMLWYVPQDQSLKPGDNVHLTVSVKTKHKKDFRVWTNNLLVHVGEAPLPRFSDHWLYGDLHYHAQMTDNDGESAYSYRNVVRGLAALGMDFAFMTDHASDGVQSDTVLNLSALLDVPGAGRITISNTKEARDLNQTRFGVAKKIIFGRNGANELIGQDVKTGGVASYHSHNVLPQIFMGEEIDAWPQMSVGEQRLGAISFGDGLEYLWSHGRNPRDESSCLRKALGKKQRSAREIAKGNCRAKYSKRLSVNQSNQPHLVLDEQGAALREDIKGALPGKKADFLGDLFVDSAPHPSRQHLVYFPFDASPGSSTGWITGKTGKFGGASRSLESLVKEISKKGHAFLAHPLEGHQPGGAGPDIVPYSESALDTAWASPGILGLQFWNEDERLRSIGPTGKAKLSLKIGVPFIPKLQKNLKSFEWDTTKPIQEIETRRNGVSTKFYNYRLPFTPARNKGTLPYVWESQVDSQSAFFDLYHGAYTWDKYLRKGLDPQHIRHLNWLRGKPRKWFMAGGSDAHGDWNFKRKGRFLPCAIEQLSPWCDFPAVDAPLGRPRNLVFVGPAHGSHSRSLPGVKRHTNRQVIDALVAGRFSVTDGPALRIAVDRNRNYKIDEHDFQMGETFHLFPGERIPIIVEWFSTPEFGPVEKVDIYLGTKEATYLTATHGVPQPPEASRRLGKNSYVSDPSGMLQVRFAQENNRPERFRGQVRLYADPKDFPGLQEKNGFFYARAFVATERSERCPRNFPTAADGSCIPRFAYSNPVWGQFIPQCQEDNLGIDMNRDGMPDVCGATKFRLDPCRRDSPATCRVVEAVRLSNPMSANPAINFLLL